MQPDDITPEYQAYCEGRCESQRKIDAIAAQLAAVTQDLNKTREAIVELLNAQRDFEHAKLSFESGAIAANWDRVPKAMAALFELLPERMKGGE